MMDVDIGPMLNAVDSNSLEETFSRHESRTQLIRPYLPIVQLKSANMQSVNDMTAEFQKHRAMLLE